MLEHPRAPHPPALARHGGDPRRHPVLLRPAVPGLGVWTLRPHFLPWNSPKKRHHHGHGTRSPDQSPGLVPRADHPGPVRPHSHKCGCSARGGVGERGPIHGSAKGSRTWHDGLDAHFFQRITPLYVHKNHTSPDTPANEPHLRRRQRDAALAAYERASTLYDRQAEDWQHTLDQDHLQIYKQAAARLEKIYKDPQHYIHDKPVRRAGHATKQYKKRLINQCKAPWQAHKHQWVPHRSGYQCQTCHTRVHQGLTVDVIETHLSQDCELLTHEAPEPDLRPDKPIGQKVTRTTAIKKLLEVQQQHPQAPDEHTFQETTGYLKCTKCNLSIHKRTNEDSFQTFIHSTCIDAKYERTHGGHGPPTPCGKRARPSAVSTAVLTATWTARKEWS